jgi:hypothetical protein
VLLGHSVVSVKDIDGGEFEGVRNLHDASVSGQEA